MGLPASERKRLAAERERLAADLERGISLPSAWYTDPAIAALERERIFRRSWQYVGRLEQVAHVGDYFTAEAGGDLPILVVRTADGLRALVNVCRHRRHPVLSGAGTCQLLQCPYHAWTYNLDGTLRNAPRADREAAFDKADYPLLPLRLDTWGRWLFVNADADAAPLATYLGPLPQLIARAGLQLDTLQCWSRAEWARPANWKVLLENFLECYHCPVQHPGFSAVIDVAPDAYHLSTAEWSSSQAGVVREPPTGQTAPYDADGELREAQYHFLWPNLTLSINPGHPNLSLAVWLPDGHGGTRGFSERYFGPGVGRQWAEELIAFDAQVTAEDDRLTDAVQRGTAAGLPDQGRFLLKSEHLIVHFQQLLLRALA